MRNMNTKATKQKLFTLRILIRTRIFIRKNWMGYYKKLKETQITITRKINIIMKMQKK